MFSYFDKNKHYVVFLLRRSFLDSLQLDINPGTFWLRRPDYLGNSPLPSPFTPFHFY